MGALRIMGVKGDTKVAWSKDNTDEVAAARRTFEDLTEKGFVAFKVEKVERQGERVLVFDPNAEQIILVPPMQGG